MIDVPRQKTMLTLFNSTRDSLRKSVMQVSCQMKLCKRTKIEKALQDYEALEVTEAIHFSGGVIRFGQARECHIDNDKVEKERATMLKALNHLRGLISKI